MARLGVKALMMMIVLFLDLMAVAQPASQAVRRMNDLTSSCAVIILVCIVPMIFFIS